MTASRRTELGDFLRSRREKLRPQAVGLSLQKARRTPGLRREEVAERAGISVDWYTRLEQGRTVTPSASTLEALAQALSLSDVEGAHLRALAHGQPPRTFRREAVPQPLSHLLNGLPQPAYLTGQRWDVLAWNAAAEALFGFGRYAETERNILLYMLTDPAARHLFGAAWASEVQRMVAQFRATYDVWGGDPAFADLVERLKDGSPEFSMWWNAHEISGVAAGQKVLHHPRRGVLRFEYASFQANDNPALKLVIYTQV